jgi:hypothetical protein
MNAHSMPQEEPRSVFEIDPGQIERNLQAAIDDVVERYGDEARHLVADAFVNAITFKRPRK